MSESDHIMQTIRDLQNRMKPHEEEIRKFKITINQLCDISGIQPMYDNVEGEKKLTTNFASDQFLGQPLASSVRDILQARKAAYGDGPATVREIYDALISGGYEFDAKDAQNAMRGLRVSLGKNTPIFYKLNSGKFGLVDWYPKIAQQRAKGGAKKEGVDVPDQAESLNDEGITDNSELDDDLDF